MGPTTSQSEPDAVAPHVRFDERGGETERIRPGTQPHPSSILQIVGRKRHIITGHLVRLTVHTADIQDRDGAVGVIGSIRQLYPWCAICSPTAAMPEKN